ncbi:MAG TPA: sigma-70 family RNA polymerase sigma factor [Terriglobia bacterium]|nr:sigma-70 family RNA polymerase sigma factor [Terriglobia bacterium]
MPTKLESEADLVAQAQAGDENAFVKIYSRHSRHIYRTAFNITQDPREAEDVLQYTFLKVFRHLEQFWSESRLSTWLTRIATNEAFARLRRRHVQKLVSLNRPIMTGGGTPMARNFEGCRDDAGEIYGWIEWQAIFFSVLN